MIYYKSKENFKFFAQSRKLKNGWKLCTFSSVFMFKFNGFVVPDSAF